MFVEEIKTSRKGKTYRSVLIRETFRIGKTVHHRTLANISKLPREYIDRIKFVLREHNLKMEVDGFDSASLQISSSKEFGASYAVLKMLRSLGLDKVIYSRKTEWRENALAMICGRIVFQGSKLSLVNRYLDTKLWELCGHSFEQRPDVDRHCYAVLDELLKRQESIQSKLAKKHLTEGSFVLYDLSSSYLVGEYDKSDLAEFGYSRDKRCGSQQINFGLLTNMEGCPISIEIFPGNTCDQATVSAQTRRISDEFGIKKIIFVGDRGMLTPKRIKEVNTCGFQTITALTHAQMRNLLKRRIVSQKQFFYLENVTVTDPDSPEVRYILCFNPCRKSRDKNTRQRLIERTEQALAKLSNRKRKKNMQSISSAVGKIWKGYKTEKYFKWEVFEDGSLCYFRKEEVISSEEELDGCYVIRADVPELGMTGGQILESYRKLSHVEQAFRYIKTTSLELRPIRHYLDDRVRAHVFLCMLSYYVEWHMLQALKPILEQKNKGKVRRWTFQQVIERLRSIQSHSCCIAGVQIRDLKTNPDSEQQQLLYHLGVDL
jgi:transposase